ncbi:MAG: LysE family transporter [Archaeoglobales archaeon]|nr:LysE family transporter [Archaeoglobales archaeon]
MLEFVAKVALISATGALTPGPLSAVAAASGVEGKWKSGFLVSLGHMAVELPLIVLISLGVLSFLTSEIFIKTSSFLGGIMLILFSYLTLKSAFSDFETQKTRKSSPFFAGVLLTLFNPFFMVWWATIGMALIGEAIMLFGYTGVLLLFFSHIWLDFGWLSFLAEMTSFSRRAILVYRTVLILLAIFVAVFGVEFLYFAIYGKHLIF